MIRVIATSVVLLLLGAASARGDSLYDERTFRPLTADRKAMQVGDTLTVQVFESSTASTSAETASQRRNALDVNLSTSAINGGRPATGSAAVAGTFDGGGTTQRSNKLLATLTVTVRGVLPNGDLVIAGEQLLTVNQEQHKVRIEGRVRPQDVSADNVVLSTRLADAKLYYAGDGDLTDRQKRAWWRALLDWLGF